MKLVIVESPAKCKTIEKYLGSDYTVVASLGHIRDLATSGKGGLGVDVENNFAPSYIINKDKRKVVSDLIRQKNKCDEVILATDPDREGEAIAWHLAQVLNLDISKTKRLEFHEITRESISSAMSNPRTIDTNLVSSQETRRILDRIIGFKLSNLLFKKIKSRSAGRVQSATLKLIFDHEKEIKEFVSEEYWKIKVVSKILGKDFNVKILDKKNKELSIHNKEEADEVLSKIGNEIKVSALNTSNRVKDSKEPFTTSTMQQEAFAKLKFKTKKTQSIAQSLYEGVVVNGEHVGLITYMRTDSPRLAPSFVERASKFIEEKYGKEYLGQIKKGKKSVLSQDAHEGIRPTSCHRTPDSIRSFLTNDQYNLYKLIYNRALASLMSSKVEKVLSINFNDDNYNYGIELAHTTFGGYEIIYKDDESDEYKGNFPNIKVGDSFPIVSKEGEQKFTEAPAHYSEAKIVKLMEEVGIGRPSTYATTIDTLRVRKYVNNAGGILTLTEQGELTANVLQKYFPNIVNVKYTANMEDKLDNVQEGSESRIQMLSDFYYPFVKLIEEVGPQIYPEKPVETGELCPECGAPLVYKESKNGKFIGCSNYPKCKYVKKEKKEVVVSEEVCPICGKHLVERKDKKGKTFLACSGFPTCKYIKPEVVKTEDEITEKKCPDCGAPLLKKKGKYGYFYGCSNYPTCHYMERISKKKHN
ncbi:MAG: type I DNA topoisomerase [Bacilli bacterium]|nr:type I DNA topoisomerase [Bacilli bacterium]